ncbi:MAG: alpha-hydroxy acid oxidase [Pseudomonadota bacterium]
MHTALATIPPEILCARHYEQLARQFMPAATYVYVAGGCGHDVTADANLDAFSRWSVYPRLLRKLDAGHTRVAIAGEQFLHPLFLAPVAFQNLAHPGAELETARGAHATDTCMVASTLSSHSLEAVARVAGPQRWFQLYFQARRNDTLDLLKRAADAGYRAIVVTLDAAIQVPSFDALRAGFRMPDGNVATNLAGHAAADAVAPGPDQSRVFQGIMRSAPTWDDLAWLLASTDLPVWIKGVLHPDDALACQAAGVAGVVVSNHGGRGLDGAPASLDTLAYVRAALGPSFPVLFDSGIRSGSDVFKAIALGADGVMLGRLQLYALSVAGGLGVAHMIKLVREELEVCMAMAGCATVDEIGRHTLLAADPRRTGM